MDEVMVNDAALSKGRSCFLSLWRWCSVDTHSGR